MSPIDDNRDLKVELSASFRRWRDSLRDPKAKAMTKELGDAD